MNELRAWIGRATQAAARGDAAPPAPFHVDAELSAPPRPLAAWTDHELETLLAVQSRAPTRPHVRDWEEAVRRVVGLHRRNPIAAARKRTRSPIAAHRLLVHWSAVLALAAWREQDLAALDGVLTLLDALDRPVARAASFRAAERERELACLARAVADGLLARLEEAP